MEFVTLSNLQNTYPNDKKSYGNNLPDSETIITLQGKYSNNTLPFGSSINDSEFRELNGISHVEANLSLLSNLNISSGVFQFIVKFKTLTQDTEGVVDYGSEAESMYYTSQDFFDKLQQQINQSNPYVTSWTIPIVTVDTAELNNFAKKEQFVVGEAYAEVDVVDNLNTTEDYLKYINWLTQPSDGRSPLIATDKLGTWNIFGPTEDLGLSFQEQLDAIITEGTKYEEDSRGTQVDKTQSIVEMFYKTSPVIDKQERNERTSITKAILKKLDERDG